LGYADLHIHMFADMAHGGAVLAGKPYAPDPDPFGKVGINQALEQDFTTLAALVDSDGNSIPAPILCPGFVNEIDPNNGCRDRFFHGDHDEFAGDPVGSDLGTQDGAASNPAFRSSMDGPAGAAPRTSRPTTSGWSAPGREGCASSPCWR
jgi:hypothetical protein